MTLDEAEGGFEGCLPERNHQVMGTGAAPPTPQSLTCCVQLYSQPMTQDTGRGVTGPDRGAVPLLGNGEE